MIKSLSVKKIINSVDVDKTEDKQNYDVKAIQAELLEMYEDVFFACEKHGLRLFLQGGTLLGKIRHDGFIPWDDDMDLGMCRDDYSRLQDVYEEELEERYLLYVPGSKDGSRTRFAQFVKKNDTGQGVWLDVFPIDYVPNNPLHRLLKGLRCTILTIITSSFELVECSDIATIEALKHSYIGLANYVIRKAVRNIFQFRSLQSWFIQLDKSVRWKTKSKYCTSSMGRLHYIGETQRTEVFFPLQRSTFCGIDAWIPNKSCEYLKHNYGIDYMAIPQESDREMHRR